MYLIQGVMANKISVIPQELPPSIYYQAGGTPPSAAATNSIMAQMTGTSGSYSPMDRSFPQQRAPVQPQYTGQPLVPETTGGRMPYQQSASHVQARPHASQIGSGAFSAQPTGNNAAWDVTQAEKASFDGFFDKLDQQRVGYIEGDVAVPFMLESQLPGEILAQVWYVNVPQLSLTTNAKFQQGSC
jgi:epidermal growth factor receptor substrate 15